MQDLAAGLGYDREPQPKNLAVWAEGLPVRLDGKPFSFNRHEYLRLPYEDSHPDQTFLKATQLGLTSLAMLRAMYGARWRGFKGILYLFPNRSDVLDFSKSRISPLIVDNPRTIGSWLKDTDAAGIKEIGNAFLYLRGMRSRAGLKSVPIDFLIADELDEAPAEAMDMAMERMSHSRFREVLKLSNPTLPDFGIDRAFQETDQRYWLLKCVKCGHFTCLEDTFPRCLLEVGEKVIRACERCQGVLNPSLGEWVAKKPSITDKRGYHFSQLFSHFVEPAEILHTYRTTNNLQNFWNLKIGNAYVEAQNRLSIEEVLALCGSDDISSSSDRDLTSMGVDQGGKELHVVIGKQYPPMAGKIIHLGIYREWEELSRLIKNFRVARCVADALPEVRAARAFAEVHKGKVYLSYFQQHQKGSYRWNDHDLTVVSNRTESLDHSHNEILNGRIVLPRENDIVREFARHLHNVAKRLDEDPETGDKKYTYVKLGDDHFRFAFSYESMARERLTKSAFNL